MWTENKKFYKKYTYVKKKKEIKFGKFFPFFLKKKNKKKTSVQ